MRKNRLILWRGAKHSGKTSSVSQLAERARNEGFCVGGLLAPSIYLNGRLTGFEAVDLLSFTRVPLANRLPGKTGSFHFMQEGLKFGHTALNANRLSFAELIIIDEFGPLEISGGGWRDDVDLLLSRCKALVLLVVRDELADAVQTLYAKVPHICLAAADPQSVESVIEMLKNRTDKVNE